MSQTGIVAKKWVTDSQSDLEIYSIWKQFFFFFNFIFKLYITVLVLPNIKMNPPQVYMCGNSFNVEFFRT